MSAVGEAHERLEQLLESATGPDAVSVGILKLLVFSAGTSGKMHAETRARLYTFLADILDSAS